MRRMEFLLAFVPVMKALDNIPVLEVTNETQPSTPHFS